MNLSGLLFAIVFFAITTTLYVVITTHLIRRSRKGRHPLNKDIKLLRQPGEGLRTQLELIDEQMTEEILKGILVPALVFSLPILVLNWLKIADHQLVTVMVLVITGCLVSLGYRIWKLVRLITKRKDYRLGLAGERAVADALDPLKAKGYRVFHDIPVQGAEKTFNLDHVVVGPTGLFCIETKARRKYAAKNGGEDHKVGFDGKALLWPNGRDEKSVFQAKKNSDWLGKWLLRQLGRSVPVSTFLAIPGWYTEETLRENVRVLSQNRLAHHIQQGQPLDAVSVDLIARQLDSLCRDVPCEA